MKESNRAVGYAFVYHGLAEIARKHGYALALHGSMLTDLDVVAIPWADEAVEPFALVKALKKHCDMCMLLDEKCNQTDKPTIRPHGRLVWKIHGQFAGAVDLSVMPRGQRNETSNR